jgi:5'-3' exonuclease
MYLYIDTNNMCHVMVNSLSEEQLNMGPALVAVNVMQEVAKSVRIRAARRAYFFIDPDEGSWRKRTFPEYKAQRAGEREKDPQRKRTYEIADKAAREVFPELIGLMGCPVFRFPYLESDDLCGAATLVNAEKPGVIFTSDKDYWQLVTKKISMVNVQHHYEVKLGDDGMLFKDLADGTVKPIGLTPPQHLLVKALMGDDGDNIPGLIGIGEVTATKSVQAGEAMKLLTEQTGMITPRKHKVYNPNPVPVQQDAVAVVNRNLSLMTLTQSVVTEKAKAIVQSIQDQGIREPMNNYTRTSIWLEERAGFGKDTAAAIAKGLTETFQGVWTS